MGDLDMNRDLNLTLLMHRQWSHSNFGYEIRNDFNSVTPVKLLPATKSYEKFIGNLKKRQEKANEFLSKLLVIR